MKLLGPRRWWRKLATALLPEPLKQRLRMRLHGYTTVRQPFKVEYIEQPDRLEAVIDDRIKLRITDDLKPVLSYHLLENADCVEEMRAFLPLAEQATVFFDAGAYAGVFCLIYCALRPDGVAVAFEPSPVMIPTINTLIELNDFSNRAVLVPRAVGKEEGEVTLSLEQVGFVQVVPTENTKAAVSVAVTTLDAESERMNLRPELLKIDVEGYELEALQGAARILKEDKPVICLELHLNYLEQRGIQPRAVIDFLQQRGYRFFSWKGESLKAEDVYDSIKPTVRVVARADR
ncbi:MAG TPA: FkbM family methyltransferase [Candidatus Obscuribacterales bacterium]